MRRLHPLLDVAPPPVRRCFAASAEPLRALAFTLHRKIRRQHGVARDEAEVARTVAIYRGYLELIDDLPRDKRYTATFYLGELMYHLDRFRDAAVAYGRAIELSRRGRLTQEAAYAC